MEFKVGERQSAPPCEFCGSPRTFIYAERTGPTKITAEEWVGPIHEGLSFMYEDPRACIVYLARQVRELQQRLAQSDLPK